MAKQTKTQTQTQTVPTPPVSAPPAVVAEVKPKVPRAKKTPAVPEVKPEPEPVSVPAPVVEQAVTEESADPADDVAVQSAEFLNKFNQWLSAGTALKAEFKTLEKKWARELKNAQKNSKRKKRGGNHSPSGFIKPTKISDELAKFLSLPVGTEIARTNVTREINQYIKTNNLQQKENGRFINADPKLAALLKLKEGDTLTYFNLQRYMKPHFVKPVVVEATA